MRGYPQFITDSTTLRVWKPLSDSFPNSVSKTASRDYDRTAIQMVSVLQEMFAVQHLIQEAEHLH